MDDDDDWETDPDYENTLTEAQQRAFGNMETMAKYNTMMEKHGATTPGATRHAHKSELDLSLAAVAPIEATSGSSPQQATPEAVHVLEARLAAIKANDPAAYPAEAARDALRQLNLTQASAPAGVAGTGTGTGASAAASSASAGAAGGAEAAGAAPGAAHKTKTLVQTEGGSSSSSVHSMEAEECDAMANFINVKLSSDAELKGHLPLCSARLFSSLRDGVLLCKLVSAAAPGTVDERALNLKPISTFHVNENMNLALNAARAQGLALVNIGAGDLSAGTPHLVLGLLWQLLKLCLLSNVSLQAHPFLVRLLGPDEELDVLLRAAPEQLLLRWLNYHLVAAGYPRRVSNFGSELSDSTAYAHLLGQLEPSKRIEHRKLADQADGASQAALLARAQRVAEAGRKLGAHFLPSASHLANGEARFGLAFVAALFNATAGNETIAEDDMERLGSFRAEAAASESVTDSREERALLKWLDSLSAHRRVRSLTTDLDDGIVLLEAMEAVRPGVVCWPRVNTSRGEREGEAKLQGEARLPIFQRLENLNYAIDLAKSELGCSLVGVQGKDLADGNRTLTLALVWQMFRFKISANLSQLRAALAPAAGAQPHAPLAPPSDEQILEWANARVADSPPLTDDDILGAAAGEFVPPPRLVDFSDKRVGSGHFLLRLVASVEPRCVDPRNIATGDAAEVCELNAKYAIACAQKLGCSLYLLWEDLVEARPKLVLSFVASVMAQALQRGVPAAPAAAAEASP